MLGLQNCLAIFGCSLAFPVLGASTDINGSTMPGTFRDQVMKISGEDQRGEFFALGVCFLIGGDSVMLDF